MKALIRSNTVQGILGFLVWAYLALVLHTIRWTRIDEDKVLAAIAQPGGVIGCFWHGTIALGIAAKPVVGTKGIRILISLSPDGEFIARAIARHDMPAIRGSSAKKGAKAKGGAAAFREALDWLSGGGILVVTPDGPRGPALQMAPGALRLAKRTQSPVFLMGLAAHPVKALNSWDRTQLPRPFGRGAIVWDGPLSVAADASDEDMARLGVEWAARLTAACDRAKAALA